MAVLTIPAENQTINNPETIREYLAPVGITYERWELAPEINADSSSEAILAIYAQQIERVKQEGNYAKVDVVNVKAETPGLDQMLAKFSTEHWHDEDEVRFTVYGRGLYHVHPTDGPVMKLEVDPGDMIRVPRGTLHWFDLCGDRQIKAVRFFQDPTGWTPHYTDSELEKQFAPICFGETYVPADARLEMPVTALK
jgi:1,2-dihydroxy-3-keto-5-methylthiopentene dioxygenase